MGRELWKMDEKSDFYYLSDDKKDLECDDCGDQSLLHARTAYYNRVKKDLLCKDCYDWLNVRNKKKYICIETNKKELCQYRAMLGDDMQEIIEL